MSKFKTKLNNFKNAISRLEESILDFNKTNMLSVRDGVIQRFEFTTDLAWKTVYEYLLEQGFVNINTPKMIISKAYSANIIDDEKGWIDILNDRNVTSHIYDETEANEVFENIKSHYVMLFKQLSDRLFSLK